jgi:hypothetical protein
MSPTVRKPNEQAAAEAKVETLETLDTEQAIGDALLAQARSEHWAAREGESRSRIWEAIRDAEYAWPVTAEEHLESVLAMLAPTLYKRWRGC